MPLKGYYHFIDILRCRMTEFICFNKISGHSIQILIIIHLHTLKSPPKIMARVGVKKNYGHEISANHNLEGKNETDLFEGEKIVSCRRQKRQLTKTVVRTRTCGQRKNGHLQNHELIAMDFCFRLENDRNPICEFGSALL